MKYRFFILFALLTLAANSASAQGVPQSDVSARLEQMADKVFGEGSYGAILDSMIEREKATRDKEFATHRKPYRDFKEAKAQGDTERQKQLLDDAVRWLEGNDHNFQSYTRNDSDRRAVMRLIHIVRQATNADKKIITHLKRRLIKQIADSQPKCSANEWSVQLWFNERYYLNCGIPILLKGRVVNSTLSDALGDKQFAALAAYYRTLYIRNNSAVKILQDKYPFGADISTITKHLQEQGKLHRR